MNSPNNNQMSKPPMPTPHPGNYNSEKTDVKSKNLIKELITIFNVESEEMLLQCAYKTQKVMKAIPRLE